MLSAFANLRRANRLTALNLWWPGAESQSACNGMIYRGNCSSENPDNPQNNPTFFAGKSVGSREQQAPLCPLLTEGSIRLTTCHWIGHSSVSGHLSAVCRVARRTVRDGLGAVPRSAIARLVASRASRQTSPRRGWTTKELGVCARQDLRYQARVSRTATG